MATPMLLEAGTDYWLFEDGTIINWGLKMTYNIFDLTYMVARELNVISEGTATGGSTTTLVDTVNLNDDDDFWNLGSMWVIYDSAGASGAPEGEYSRVSDFDSGTSTATFPAITTAIAAGDRYAIADDEFPLDLLISQISRSLTGMGRIVYTDTTTITTADNQTEYTLPGGLAAGSLREVWLQGEDNDANDNRWTRIYNYEIQRTATGTADEIIFQYQYASGYAVKLVYIAPHPNMYSISSKLSETIPLPNIIYPAVLNCLRYKKRNTENPKYDMQIVKYETLIPVLEPLEEPQKSGKLLTLGAVGTQESEPDKVYL